MKGTNISGKPRVKHIGAEHDPKYQPITDVEVKDRLDKRLVYHDTFARTEKVVNADGKKARLSVSAMDDSDANGQRVVVDKQGRFYVGHPLSDQPYRAMSAGEVAAYRSHVVGEVHSFRQAMHINATKFDKPAEKLASHIADTTGLPVSLHHPDDANSRYVYVDMPKGGQFKIRFADHAEPIDRDWKNGGKVVAVGGYDTSAGKRHTAADVSIDPKSGLTPTDALNKLLQAGGVGKFHESIWDGIDD